MQLSPSPSIYLGHDAGIWLAAAMFMATVLLASMLLRKSRQLRDAREGQRNSATLIDDLAIGIYRTSPEGRQLSANKALVALNGYASEAEMLAAVSDIGGEWYVDPSRRDEFRRILQQDGYVDDFVSEIYRHKTRERIWIRESARVVRKRNDGEPLYYEGSVQEVTETVKRLQLEQQFQKLTSQLPGGLFQVITRKDGRNQILYLSPGVADLTGISVHEHIQRADTITALVVPEQREAYLETRRRAVETQEPWEHEFQIRRPDGEERWLRVSARVERVDGDTIWHGYLSDISVRKRQEIEIEELAYFDPLTKLPNRRMFLARIAAAVETSRRRLSHGALLFIDLDNFKSLNDTQGHDVGDLFLVKVAERLRGCLESEDLVARLGGDEFVVVIEKAGVDASRATVRAIHIANRILSAMRREFALGEVRHVASASVGVVVFDGIEKQVDELMRMADTAMYQAKAAGRNGMALFDRSAMESETTRYRLLHEVRAAIERDELDLFYQPIVNDTGAVCGAEALIRWVHPDFGLLLPDKFVPVVEQYGLSKDLCRLVFRKGMAQLARWQADPSTAHLRLSLNVSVQCFSDPAFAMTVRELIRSSGADPKKLTFELTEHVMAKDHVRVAAIMREVKSIGVRLSLDDFGTGYSSLTYLKELPFDEVKIDGGFVSAIESSDSNRALVKTILAMARTLGLKAVAEHVENVRQEAFLRAFGCDYLQGYLYGQAMPPGAFLKLLDNRHDGHRPVSKRSLG